MQQSEALAVADDEEGEHDKSNDEMRALKRQIREMLEEKKQRDDYHRRLQRKITKLNASLADVVEEEEGLRRKQEHERKKKEDENQSFKNELLSRARNQEERIRDHLSDVLYTKPPSSRGKQFALDTVRVTNLRFQHPLAFRIDDSTTVIKLRNNACKYWNVVPDDYILKTMANNKCSDEIRVKECFKQGELAQLRLEEKKMEPSKPSEEELKAIMPKGKGRKTKHRDLRYNTDGIEKIQKHIDSYTSQLRKMGGIYFLLKLRDMKPSEHCSKIKLRDIIIYLVLAILTFGVYVSRRPAGQDFWFMTSIEDRFMQRVPRTQVTGDQYTTYVPGFREVRSIDDMWDWLEITLPGIIWSQSDFSLAAYNLLVGKMCIRVKNVARPDPLWRDCGDNRALTEQLQGACYATHVGSGTEDTSDFPGVISYWDAALEQDAGDPERIRGRAQPGRWVSAEENRRLFDIGDVYGAFDSYDGGGYSVQYTMQAPNKTKAVHQYKQDLAKFKEVAWISFATRAVVISFTTYNFDYDMWLASDFLFEIPPSGSISSSSIIRPFKPRLDETRQELTETYIDYVRIIIAVYILIFVGMNERRHKIKYHKAGAWYHLTLNGITDFGIVTCIWIVVLWRSIGFRGEVAGKELGKASAIDAYFHSFSGLAYTYETIFCIEGLVMVFLMFRLLSFFRLNHTIYLLWKALGRAWGSFFGFTCIFLLPIIGFILMLNASYGPFMEEYSQISKTTLQFYRIVLGNVDTYRLLKLDSIGAVSFIIIFYIVITFLMMNVFVTIVVDAYYIVQITAGGPGEKWQWHRYYKWAVPGLLVNLFQAFVPSQARYPERV